jgi:hypothetical protein
MISIGPVFSTDRPIIHGKTIDPILPLIKNQLVILPVITTNDSVNVSIVAKIDAIEKPNNIDPIHNTITEFGNNNIIPRAIADPIIS